MGRYYFDAKTTVEETKQLSIFKLKEFGFLRGSCEGTLTWTRKAMRARLNRNIGKLHSHMLRHTYLTRLYNVEKDLRFVQNQAGHASPTTTVIYAKTNNTARRRQVEAMD